MEQNKSSSECALRHNSIHEADEKTIFKPSSFDGIYSIIHTYTTPRWIRLSSFDGSFLPINLKPSNFRRTVLISAQLLFITLSPQELLRAGMDKIFQANWFNSPIKEPALSSRRFRLAEILWHLLYLTWHFPANPARATRSTSPVAVAVTRSVKRKIMTVKIRTNPFATTSLAPERESGKPSPPSPLWSELWKWK